MVACSTDSPTVTTPCPRKMQTLLSPMAAATARPSSGVRTSTGLGYTGTPWCASRDAGMLYAPNI